MKRATERITVLIVLLLTLATVSSTNAADKSGWISLFDGKTLDGWKASENPESFSIRDGIIVANAQGEFIQEQAHHPKSHLFYVGPDGNASFTNFEFQADVMAKSGSNGGIYFHTEYVNLNWPQKGFEVQINNSQKDPRKTGSLYAVQDVADPPAKDNQWFTVWIKVEGKRVQIKVNGTQTVDWTEPEGFVQVKRPWFSERRLSSGTFVLQAHDPHSMVYFKNLMVKPLPLFAQSQQPKITYRFLSFTKNAPVPEGMGEFRSTWNSVGMDPDENVYVVWADQKGSWSRQDNRTGHPYSDCALCRYDTKNDRYETLGSLVKTLKAEKNWSENEFVEKGHTQLLYMDGKIYLGTMAFHQIEGRVNDPMDTQRAYCLNEMSKYRGAHLLAYDIQANRITDVTKNLPGGVLFENQGLIALGPLPELNYLVCLSTPRGDLAFYNFKTGEVDRIVKGVESELGNVIHREVIATPQGKVYFGFADRVAERGKLYVYDLNTDTTQRLPDLPKGTLNGLARTKDRKHFYAVTQNCDIVHFNTETDEVTHIGSLVPEDEDGKLLAAGLRKRCFGLVMSSDDKHLFAVVSTMGTGGYNSGRGALGVYEYDLPTNTSTKIYDFNDDPSLVQYTTDFLTGSHLIDSKGRIYTARNAMRSGEVGFIQIDLSSRMSQ